MSSANARLIDVSVLSATDAPQLYRSREFWEKEFRQVGLWPDLLSWDAVSREFSSLIDVHFRRYQLIAVSRSERAQVVGVAHSVPLCIGGSVHDLPENGWDWALETSMMQRKKGLVPETLCGLSISVLPGFQRRGVGEELIRAVVMAARDNGLQQVIMPVRPLTKEEHPLLSMEEFMNFVRKDGLHEDPWIRAHQKCGGVIGKICHRSMTVTASISEWSHWSGNIFRQTGRYAVKDCLAPVNIDMEHSIGVYEEPNVWVSHSL